jgi:hypothetical protein
MNKNTKDAITLIIIAIIGLLGDYIYDRIFNF